jgi:hypothetical protein
LHLLRLGSTVNFNSMIPRVLLYWWCAMTVAFIIYLHTGHCISCRLRSLSSQQASRRTIVRLQRARETSVSCDRHKLAFFCILSSEYLTTFSSRKGRKQEQNDPHLVVGLQRAPRPETCSVRFGSVHLACQVRKSSLWVGRAFSPADPIE